MDFSWLSTLGLTHNDSWPPVHLHGVLIHTSVCGAAPLQRLMFGSCLCPHQISSSDALSDTVQARHVKILMIFSLKELGGCKCLIWSWNCSRNWMFCALVFYLTPKMLVWWFKNFTFRSYVTNLILGFLQSLHFWRVYEKSETTAFTLFKILPVLHLKIRKRAREKGCF